MIQRPMRRDHLRASSVYRSVVGRCSPEAPKSRSGHGGAAEPPARSGGGWEALRGPVKELGRMEKEERIQRATVDALRDEIDGPRSGSGRRAELVLAP